GRTASTHRPAKVSVLPSAYSVGSFSLRSRTWTFWPPAARKRPSELKASTWTGGCCSFFVSSRTTSSFFLAFVPWASAVGATTANPATAPSSRPPRCHKLRLSLFIRATSKDAFQVGAVPPLPNRRRTPYSYRHRRRGAE